MKYNISANFTILSGGTRRRKRLIFLGQFFQWDGNSNAKIANKNGFTYYEKLVEGAANNYENLDN